MLRNVSTFGLGIQMLDLEDYCTQVGLCEHSYSHRDWDNNVLNSLTVVLARSHGAMGYQSTEDGNIVDELVRAEPGILHVFLTNVYHFGASHMYFCQSDKSAMRRRGFCYLDWETDVTDEEGFVNSENARRVPAGYTHHAVEYMSTMEYVISYMPAPPLEGHTAGFENNKLVGTVA